MQIKFEITSVGLPERANRAYILHLKQMDVSAGINQPGQSVMQVHLPDELGKKLHVGQIFTAELYHHEHNVGEKTTDDQEERAAIASLAQQVLQTRERMTQQLLSGSLAINPLPYRAMLDEYERRAASFLEKKPGDVAAKSWIEQAQSLKAANEF